jgi:RNA polymerase sigma-70 factor (ECF subfamily)
VSFDDLVERAGQGDRDALGELWTQHQHLLLRFLRGLGCRTPEDLASVVWIDVARVLPTCTGGLSGFRRLLFTIARRRWIDALRAESRRPQVVELTDASTELAASLDDVHDQATALERALALVRSLPADQAEIVLLRVVADLDVAEVARIVGKREGNVRVIMHRALQRLADLAALDAPVGGVTERTPRSMKEVP